MHQNFVILNFKVSPLDLICPHAKGFQLRAMNCYTKISRTKENQNNDKNTQALNSYFFVNYFFPEIAVFLLL